MRLLHSRSIIGLTAILGFTAPALAQNAPSPPPPAQQQEMNHKATPPAPSGEKTPMGQPGEKAETMPKTQVIEDQGLIRRAQSALKDQGFYKAKVDGIAGKQTKSAVTDFQKRNMLTVNGMLDVETAEALGIPRADIEKVSGKKHNEKQPSIEKERGVTPKSNEPMQKAPVKGQTPAPQNTPPKSNY
jgi:peptidoglycan hydrolase-like protein with peptidoglycan-binding domain